MIYPDDQYSAITQGKDILSRVLGALDRLAIIAKIAGVDEDTINEVKVLIAPNGLFHRLWFQLEDLERNFNGNHAVKTTTRRRRKTK